MQLSKILPDEKGMQILTEYIKKGADIEKAKTLIINKKNDDQIQSTANIINDKEITKQDLNKITQNTIEAIHHLSSNSISKQLIVGILKKDEKKLVYIAKLIKLGLSKDKSEKMIKDESYYKKIKNLNIEEKNIIKAIENQYIFEYINSTNKKNREIKKRGFKFEVHHLTK